MTIFFGIACIVLMTTIGLAIDSARYYNLSSKMQDALDAAALTGAKLLKDEQRSHAEITDIVQRNFNAAMKKAGVKAAYVAPLAVAIDRKQSTVDAKSHVLVRSFFGSIASGSQNVEINRNTKVVYEMNQIELAMVLDITGSMIPKNKLVDLKTAATDIVDELLGDAISEKSIRIAVAPYSASVNAGALANAVSMAPPAENCESWQQGQGCKTSAGKALDTCVIERTGANALTDAAPLGLDKLPSVPSLPYGNYTCPAATVVPLRARVRPKR